MNPNIILFVIIIIINILFAISEFRDKHNIMGSALIITAIGLLIKTILLIV